MNIVEKADKIVNELAAKGSENYCTLALISPQGYPMMSTITISKCDGIKWMTFCTGHGVKDERIKHSDKAGVCINSENYHISLTGRIEIVEDIDVKREMWYEGLENHFSGYDDPNYNVLKFTAEEYNLLIDWEAAKGKF